MRDILDRVRVFLCGYPLVVPDTVLVYHARKAGVPLRAMRAAWRSYPPDVQRGMAAFTRIDQAMNGEAA